MRRFWLGLFLLASVPASGQTPDPSEGRDADFGAKLLIIDDLNGFWTEWEKPDNPSVTTTSKITRAHPVYAIIVFHDCQAGADGKCKVTVRFGMTGPDGKPYGAEPHDGLAWAGAPAPNHNIQASNASLGFILEPQDKLGRYEIWATLKDEVSGRSVTLREDVMAEAETPTAN